MFDFNSSLAKPPFYFRHVLVIILIALREYNDSSSRGSWYFVDGIIS